MWSFYKNLWLVLIKPKFCRTYSPRQHWGKIHNLSNELKPVINQSAILKIRENDKELRRKNFQKVRRLCRQSVYFDFGSIKTFTGIRCLKWSSTASADLTSVLELPEITKRDFTSADGEECDTTKLNWMNQCLGWFRESFTVSGLHQCCVLAIMLSGIQPHDTPTVIVIIISNIIESYNINNTRA